METKGKRAWVLAALVALSLSACGGRDAKPKADDKKRTPLLTEEMIEMLGGIRTAPTLAPHAPPPTEFPAGPDKVARLAAYLATEPEDLDDSYDVIAYAGEVQAELGRFATFNVFTEGTHIIPITLNGVEVPAGQHGPGDLCDRPPWLGVGAGGGAKPYARVGRLKPLKADGTPNPDVDWVFIARRYAFRDDPSHPEFEDVAVIGSHRVTGATAFFQMLSPDTPKNATSVPSPMDPDPAVQERARGFWLTPQRTAGIGCYECHTGDPWIHTPYIDQVTITNEDGSRAPIVPRGVDLSAVPKHDLPYRFIGSEAFSAWPQPMHFKPDENLCLKCHRIGTEPRGNFVAYSTGRAFPESQSDMFKTYPRSHWMPPGVAKDMPQAQFQAVYGTSIDQLLSILQNPNQPGANRRPVP